MLAIAEKHLGSILIAAAIIIAATISMFILILIKLVKEIFMIEMITSLQVVVQVLDQQNTVKY